MRGIGALAVLWFSSLLASLNGKPYIVGDIMGQLGNQMFIIAATTSLALDNGAEPIFPGLATEADWNVPLNYKKIFYHLNASTPPTPPSYYHIESHFHFAPIPYRPNMGIRGWFQSEKYFKKHKQYILNLFAPPPEIVNYLTSKYSALIQNPKTVSIHYRSYDKEDPNNDLYYKCDKEYYKNAINLFPKDSLFVVFSNQIDWCKRNFADIPRNFVYIEGEAYYHDIYLMSFCKHNIICNSSFSWWAAYLNPNPNKIVIVPPGWLNPKYKADTQDLIPEEWIIINSCGVRPDLGC